MKTLDEAGLHDALHRAANTATTDPHAYIHTMQRTTRLARRRQLVTATASVAVVAVVGAGVFATAANDGARSSVSTGPAAGAATERAADGALDTAVPTTPESPSPSYEFGDSSFTRTSSSDEEASVGPTGLHLQTFVARPGESPALYVITADPSTSYGIGEGAPGATKVQVRGQDAIFVAVGGLTSLGWREPDGTTVSLRSDRFKLEQMLEVGALLQDRAIGMGWDLAGPLPDQLLPAFDGGGSSSEGTSRERNFEGDGLRVTLRWYPGGEFDFEERLLDRRDSAEMTFPQSIAGYEGFAVRNGERVSVLWWDGSQVGELVIEPTEAGRMLPATTIDPIVAAVRTVD